MSWLDRFFQGGIKNVAIAGTLLPQEVTLNFVSGASGVDNPGLSRSDVTISVLATPSGTGFVHITGGVVDAAARAVNLSGADVTSTLGVTNGGTGAATLTAHAVLLGEGTSAVAFAGPGTTGLPLVAQGVSADPIFAVLGVAGGGTGLSTVGSNGQILTVVSGAPAWAANAGSTTWSNDLSGNGTTTNTNQYVSSLSFSSAAAGGTIAVNGTNTTLQWASGGTNAGLSQASTSGATGANLTIASQASTANPGTGGNVVLSVPAKVGAGSVAYVVIQGGGNPHALIGGWNNSDAGAGALWLGNVTPSTSNYAVFSDGTSATQFACPTGGTWYLLIGNGGNSPVTGTTNGVQLFSTTQSLGGGTGVLGVTNATTAPTTNPTGGGVLYAQAGAGKWRGSSGTVTTFGPAEPHCPVCGSDFTTEHESEKYGYLAVCLKCLADELGDRPWIQRHKHAPNGSGAV